MNTKNTQLSGSVTVYCGTVWHVAKPELVHSSPERSIEHIPQGAIAVGSDGRILACSTKADVLKTFPAATVKDFGAAHIFPGMVDAHVHFPQTAMIASYGESLLGWLEKHAFPEERKFSDEEYARKIAQSFCRQLAKNGTTTAAVFGSCHESSTHTLFEAFESLGLRGIIGKISMNQNVPADIQTPCIDDEKSLQSLIHKWHGKHGRLFYALTPRFAPACSEAMLTRHSDVMKSHPTVYLQTHASENKAEVEWVRSLFPKDRDYLSVYHRFGLLGPQTLMAHSIYYSKHEWNLAKETQTKLIHCPSSNLFLGSGLFDYGEAVAHSLSVGIASDVGGGSTFSIWKNMADAYRIQRLRNGNIHPATLLHLATTGGAQALNMHDKIGNFSVGKQADFVVVDDGSDELFSLRTGRSGSLTDLLFGIIFLADDRNTVATYAGGAKIYERAN
jgi:guanine deaminase